MFGDNPIRIPENHSGDFLDIQEIFYTIQGEGIYSGQPALFIRLGGCNLACNFCDTEFESFKRLSLSEIMKKAFELAPFFCKLVVITGGEPFRQPIEKLCQELINAKFNIQIETNGTLYREIPKEVEIICSPKNNGKGYFQIRDDLLQRITAFKFILSKHNKDYLDVPEVGQSKYSIPVYIQPMDEGDILKNKDNLNLVLETALSKGYYISIQLHKYLGVS